MTSPKPNVENQEKEIRISLTPENAKPFFCNVANFARVSDGYVLMTFSFVEHDGSGNGTVVGRFVIDQDHAKRFVKVLNDLLEKKKS